MSSDKELFVMRMSVAEIPPRFQNARIEDLDDAHKTVIKSFLEAKGWRALVLMGPVGVGKTHAACAIVTEFCKTFNGLYTTALAMSKRIISDKNALHFTKYKLLAIDELGRTFDSKPEKDRFFDVINYRYDNGMPTILSGNIQPGQLKEILGDAITDRINHSAYPILMTGESRRVKQGELL